MNLPENNQKAVLGNSLECAAEIVSAYVSNNSIPSVELPGFISAVHTAIVSLESGPVETIPETAKEPAVAVKNSVTKDFIICLEDGKKFKSLRRHLASAFSMTPEQYRTKWDLPKDYPMVAPGYAAVRSQLARQAGLGTKVAAKLVPPAVKVSEEKVAGRRGRPRKAA